MYHYLWDSYGNPLMVSEVGKIMIYEQRRAAHIMFGIKACIVQGNGCFDEQGIFGPFSHLVLSVLTAVFKWKKNETYSSSVVHQTAINCFSSMKKLHCYIPAGQELTHPFGKMNFTRISICDRVFKMYVLEPFIRTYTDANGGNLHYGMSRVHFLGSCHLHFQLQEAMEMYYKAQEYALYCKILIVRYLK